MAPGRPPSPACQTRWNALLSQREGHKVARLLGRDEKHVLSGACKEEALLLVPAGAVLPSQSCVERDRQEVVPASPGRLCPGLVELLVLRVSDLCSRRREDR